MASKTAVFHLAVTLLLWCQLWTVHAQGEVKMHQLMISYAHGNIKELDTHELYY